MQDVTTSLISKFVSEIGEMQNRLNELERIKAELEEELGKLKCAEEESCAVKASLEEQLANGNARNDFLSANLKNEINERKRIEEELRASEARYRNLVENMNDIVMEVDANGNYCYLSPNLSSISDYSFEEELGEIGYDAVFQEFIKLQGEMEDGNHIINIVGEPVHLGYIRALNRQVISVLTLTTLCIMVLLYFYYRSKRGMFIPVMSAIGDGVLPCSISWFPIYAGTHGGSLTNEKGIVYKNLSPIAGMAPGDTVPVS